MPRGDVHYPHRIGYRLDDETWLELNKVVAGTGFSPHDWCRMAALEKLNDEHGLTQNERVLFEQVARIQYLLGQAFQLLADDRLGSEEWNTIRTYAREKVAVIADKVLADARCKRDIAGRPVSSRR